MQLFDHSRKCNTQFTSELEDKVVENKFMILIVKLKYDYKMKKMYRRSQSTVDIFILFEVFKIFNILKNNKQTKWLNLVWIKHSQYKGAY